MKQLCDICAGVGETPFGECSNCKGTGFVNWLDNIVDPFKYEKTGQINMGTLIKYIQECFERVCLHQYFGVTLEIEEVKNKMNMIMESIGNFGFKFENYQLMAKDPNYLSFVLYFTPKDYHEFVIKRG